MASPTKTKMKQNSDNQHKTAQTNEPSHSTKLRQTISLDGIWQIAEGATDQRPALFDRKVPVPGLVDLAQPAFAPDSFSNTKRRSDAEDAVLAGSSYWYRREFKLKGDVPAVATLLVRKAAFGSTVYLNGIKVGESLASFTANHYDARAALHGGGAVNELVIRVGASRASLPPSVPSGFDVEKKRYIPGLFDSIELALSNTPDIVNVQAAPDIWKHLVRVHAQVRNSGAAAMAHMKFLVREAKSGKVVGEASAAGEIASGAEKTFDVNVPIAGCRLWSPEDPFLYTLEVSTGADTLETRFGMREFRFEPRHGDQAGRAYLNGKPYFLRGSNVTLYRFFEDPDRGELPWNESWVRRLHRDRFKDMHWNALRYSIGFPPELWYRIADEEGILIQDEFPIWEPWGPKWFDITIGALVPQYAAWMQERWNHPCVVIWDAQNETGGTETGAALAQVRGLDLSNRPWDDGWGESPERPETDLHESHVYHFMDERMTLSKAMQMDDKPPYPLAERKASILNEYGWLWLNRDGTPTTLTKKVFENLAGKDAPPAKLIPLAARLLAAETEFWRCHRQVAGLMEFGGLGYSRPDGQTSDHWQDVKGLVWEPEFYRYVRDAFAPVGLMVDFAPDNVLSGSKATRIPVLVINDLENLWSGPVTLRLKCGERLHAETKQECHLEPWGKAVLNFEMKWPEQAGHYTLEAELNGTDGKPVRSLRDIEIIPEKPLKFFQEREVLGTIEINRAEQLHIGAETTNPQTHVVTPAAWKGPQDCSLKMQFMRTTDKVKFQIEVTDDHLVPAPTNKAVWEGDAVELFFDFGRKDLDKDKYQVCIAADGRIQCSPDKKLPQGFAATVQKSAAGYSIEGSFLITPEMADAIGFDVAVDDDDDGSGLKSQAFWIEPKKRSGPGKTMGILRIR